MGGRGRRRGADGLLDGMSTQPDPDTLLVLATVLTVRTRWQEPFLDGTLGVEFDRPFGFVVRHRPSGLVLLAGWVTEPDPPLPVREFSRGEDDDF
ncbi:hypothetical protein ACFQO7_17370 [Catellatospora aurea]|uniref:Uncharacterized protein n=1 Tax=Catellatospora aurea TaxID=1337874 RepID=A0ABW2GW37_9ACTN